MPDPVSATIGGAATVGSTFMATRGAKKAAKAQEDASNYAADIQFEMYRQTRKDLRPWREAGTTAVNKLTRILKKHHKEDLDFEASPQYEFVRGEGLRGIERGMSAMGRGRSGAHMKAAGRYASDLASGEYQNWLNNVYRKRAERINPWLSLAGLGQVATANTGRAGSAAAGRAGEAALYGGQAAASGHINVANALTAPITGAANQLLYYNAMRNMPQPSPASHYYGSYPSNYVPPGSSYVASR